MPGAAALDLGDPEDFPEPGFVTATLVDATEGAVRVEPFGAARAHTLVEVAYACSSPTIITVRAIDAKDPGVTVAEFIADCVPGRPGRLQAPAAATRTSVTFEAVADPVTRYWVKLGVPAADLLP